MLLSGNIEPTIYELLHDPIADLVRRRDRIALEDVCACIEEASQKLRRCSAPKRHPR